MFLPSGVSIPRPSGERGELLELLIFLRPFQLFSLLGFVVIMVCKCIVYCEPIH